MITLQELIEWNKTRLEPWHGSTRMKNYPLTPLGMLRLATADIDIEGITCSFYGGNDSGDIEDITVYKGNKRDIKLPDDIQTIVEDQFWRILTEMYGSFAGEFTASGEIDFYKSTEDRPDGYIDSSISEMVLSDDPTYYFED